MSQSCQSMEVVSKPGLSNSNYTMPPWLLVECLLHIRCHPKCFDMNYFTGSLQNPLPREKNPDTKDHILYDLI